MKARSAGWIVGTVVLVLAIFAASWFLLASPRFDAAAETLADAEETRNRNEILQMQVAQLAAEYERLPEYRAELAGIQTQIPQMAYLGEYAIEIDGLAADNDVTILEVAPGVATLVTFAEDPRPTEEPAEEPAEPDAEESEDESGDGEATEEPASPPAPTGPPQVEGFVAVPIMIKVVGTYEDTIGFLEDLQTGPDRLFLVTEINTIRQREAEEGGGKPALEDGDVELQVAGFAYVLVDPIAAGLTGVPTERELLEELPRSNGNPYVPLEE